MRPREDRVRRRKSAQRLVTCGLRSRHRETWNFGTNNILASLVYCFFHFRSPAPNPRPNPERPAPREFFLFFNNFTAKTRKARAQRAFWFFAHNHGQILKGPRPESFLFFFALMFAPVVNFSSAACGLRKISFAPLLIIQLFAPVVNFSSAAQRP